MVLVKYLLSAIWNADNHSSGIYLVKLIIGKNITTTKLMLVK